MEAAEQDNIKADSKRTGSPSVIEVIAPPSELSAAAVKAEGAVEGAIRSILEVPPLPQDEVPVAALRTLKKLEQRKLPASVGADHFEPKHNPRTSCFDAASLQASWTSHSLCERCAAFNEILQGKCSLSCICSTVSSTNCSKCNTQPSCMRH